MLRSSVLRGFWPFFVCLLVEPTVQEASVSLQEWAQRVERARMKLQRAGAGISSLGPAPAAPVCRAPLAAGQLVEAQGLERRRGCRCRLGPCFSLDGRPGTGAGRRRQPRVAVQWGCSQRAGRRPRRSPQGGPCLSPASVLPGAVGRLLALDALVESPRVRPPNAAVARPRCSLTAGSNGGAGSAACEAYNRTGQRWRPREPD